MEPLIEEIGKKGILRNQDKNVNKKSAKRSSLHKRNAGRDLSLRSFFMATVFFTFCGVVSLSGMVIAGCVAFRNYLLPDANEAYLTVEQMMDDGSVSSSTHLLTFGEETRLPQLYQKEKAGVETDQDGNVLEEWGMFSEDGDALRTTIVHGAVLDATYSIQKIERSYDTLTPKRKLAYQLSGVAMVAVPAVLSIGGILFCGFYFYRKRLSLPLRLLEEATEQIGAQNLDFTLEYDCGDELGMLCRSFELMRKELAENNKVMWNLLEQRKLMQASIAHDLRNPIAIIRGYTEYLQINLPEGKISQEKAERIASNLNLAAKRLEQYTESVRTLNQLEDMEIRRKRISAAEWIADIREDLEIMAARAGKILHLGDVRKEETLFADSTVLYRILENIFENALRYAKTAVSVSFLLEEETLQITVADDGEGFPEEFLSKGNLAFRVNIPAGHGQRGGHLGIGLAISRILCEKHGGCLQIGNMAPHGGVVKMFLTV